MIDNLVIAIKIFLHSRIARVKQSTFEFEEKFEFFKDSEVYVFVMKSDTLGQAQTSKEKRKRTRTNKQNHSCRFEQMPKRCCGELHIVVPNEI